MTHRPTTVCLLLLALAAWGAGPALAINETAQLIPGDLDFDDRYGLAVAVSGDTALTLPGVVIDPGCGCSIFQFCPCDGPRGTNQPWRNHGKYVSCVAHTTNSFLGLGLITEVEKDEIVSAAAESDCGDKR